MPKKPILLALFIIFYTITHAQYADWMLGTWQSSSGTTTPSGTVTNIIRISDVSRESFSGTKTSESNNAKITISISGSFRAKGLYLQNGEVLQKEPQNGQWPDCGSCTETNKMLIRRDSLILVDSISGCNNACDAVTFYYRLLSEYDKYTQLYLVDRFGRPADIIGFHPYETKKVDSLAANVAEPVKKNAGAVTMVPDPDAASIKNKEKMRRDSLDNIVKIKQQQKDEAARLALQKKREKQITDSLNLLQQKEARRLKDSLDNVARLEKMRLRTEDSLHEVQAKKRQQQIADSMDLVQQKAQQRLKDSLDNVARIRQQHIDDSTQLAQQRKREQEIADSLDLANQREQQHIKDSLQNAAAINLQKQRTADSLLQVQAKKRQQEITDSLAARRQQYNDSLQKAALAKATGIAPPAADRALTTRTNVLLQTYHISSPDILIELFDNGEIDSDRVSVYHNNTIIVSNEVLGKKAITLNVHADATNREHEFVLVAENLGSIPPNSALMRITAGKESYKLSVNTDMKTNARIVFYYDGN